MGVVKLQVLVYDILLWRKVPESGARSVGVGVCGGGGGGRGGEGGIQEDGEEGGGAINRYNMGSNGWLLMMMTKK